MLLSYTASTKSIISDLQKVGNDYLHEKERKRLGMEEEKTFAKVPSNREEKQRGSNERRNYIATVFTEEGKRSTHRCEKC